MTDRRYTDDEVAEIFKRAATAHPALPTERAVGDGLSLAELQEVGLEVGIPGELVASAAQSLESAPVVSLSRFLGLPVGVRDSVELDRRLTDAEWDQMVVAARDAFSARGELSSAGAFKEWHNGNLAMMLEPTPTGHRIRLQTRNANAVEMLRVGTVLMGFAGVLGTIGLTVGGTKGPKVLVLVAMFLGMGALLGGSAALRLPGWASRRREQMRALAAKAKAISAGTPPTALEP